jgi:hypothetical protein
MARTHKLTLPLGAKFQFRLDGNAPALRTPAVLDTAYNQDNLERPRLNIGQDGATVAQRAPEDPFPAE